MRTTPANNRATGSPTIDGTPQVDHTLTVDTSDIADADGLTHASYTWLYQWIRNNSEIAGATEPTYTLVDADARKTIKVKVSFTDDANNQESRTSARTMPIELPPNILPTGLPTINGTPQVRRPLTVDTSEIADADGMEESVFLYQWLAKNSEVTRELAGEHSPTYTPSPAEEGFAIMVGELTIQQTKRVATVTQGLVHPGQEMQEPVRTGPVKDLHSLLLL